MSQIGTLNYQWAFSLINNFSLHGVTQAVISPGSRSTPLALACEKHPNIKTWVHIDERSAGFFALGLAQQECQPVILICTSGSAVANWFPAVVEANHSYVPLLLLSADRPAELHQCGANQTIDQASLFGSHVRSSIVLEAVDEILLNNNYLKRMALKAYGKSLNHKPGPVHINIPFKEPLLPRRFTAQELNLYINRLSHQISKKATPIIQSSDADLPISNATLQTLCEILESGNGLIICGRLTPQEQRNFFPSVNQLAKKLNCPILLDPLSNLRFLLSSSKYSLYNYDHFLKQYLVHEKDKKTPDTPAWILRFGQFPVSKNLMQYLQNLDTHTLLVSPYGDWLDPIHKASTLLHTSPERLCKKLLTRKIQSNPSTWLHKWLASDKKSEKTINNCISILPTLFEGHIITVLLNSIPENSLIFSGNSMAIRDFDTFITRSSSCRKNLLFYGNRGASGIDGNISTFLGLLAKRSVTNKKNYGVILLGDLSFYHDMNGLLMCKKLVSMGYNGAIIIINNGGGGIFSYLPQNQLDDFDKLWKTNSYLDFQYSAKLYGLNYQRIENKKELEVKLPKIMSQSGLQVVEIIIDHENSIECHHQI